jgi:serine/threonine protein kinase
MVNKPTISDSEFYRLLFDKIQNKKLHFSRKVILSVEVKDLLNRMLDKNPFTRITMKEVLIHPWVQNSRLHIQPTKEKKKRKKRTFLSHATSFTKSFSIKNHSFDQKYCNNKQKRCQLSASGIIATRHRAHDIIVKQFIKDRSDNPSKKSSPSQPQPQPQQQNQERSCTLFLKASKETDR